MALYELNDDHLAEIKKTRFDAAGVKERGDLQRLLRDQIEILVPDALVLAEEFGEWEDSQRRIDLLLLGRDATLVVVELKRTEHGGHMELQAIRYAAMVSTMTFEQAVDAHQAYLLRRGTDGDARARILAFLGWDAPNEDEFAQGVRIVLASAEFSKELTTAVMWLNTQGLDVVCIRLRPYLSGGKVLVEVQQVIPLPEAEEYQVRLREKSQREQNARGSAWTEDRLLASIASKHGADARQAAKALLDLGSQQADFLWWGAGKRDGMAIPTIERNGAAYYLFRVHTNGNLIFVLDHLQGKPPFDRQEFLRELANRLKEIDGIDVPDSELAQRRRIPLASLAGGDALAKVQEIVGWMTHQIRAQEKDVPS